MLCMFVWNLQKEALKYFIMRHFFPCDSKQVVHGCVWNTQMVLNSPLWDACHEGVTVRYTVWFVMLVSQEDNICCENMPNWSGLLPATYEKHLINGNIWCVHIPVSGLPVTDRSLVNSTANGIMESSFCDCVWWHQGLHGLHLFEQ